MFVSSLGPDRRTGPPGTQSLLPSHHCSYIELCIIDILFDIYLTTFKSLQFLYILNYTCVVHALLLVDPNVHFNLEPN
jgi:hypothetical protein